MRETDDNPARRSSLLVTHKKRWNGEAEYAACLIEAEAELGYRVTLIAPEDCELVRRVRDRVEFIPLPASRPSGSPRDFIRTVGFISRLLESGDFDIIHSSRATAHLMTALAVRKKLPFIHLRSGAKKPYGHPANRILYRGLTDEVIVSSLRIKKWLIKGLGMDPARVHRLLAPVDIDYFTPGPSDPGLFRELGLEPDRQLVVNVARLAPVKGHDFLVEAMAAVVKKHPRAVLAAVGNPWQDQPTRILRRARELGIEGSVVCPGRREDVERFVRAAAVCVSSSVGSEENSRAVTEYMACGRPTVVTAVGVMPELVEDGVSGKIVPPRAPSPLAAAIADILADPARARAMGEAARKAAEDRFSGKVFRGKLKQILDRALVSHQDTKTQRDSGKII